MIYEIIIICIIGTLLHFTYELSNHNKVVAALFSAVNESVWEHIKIALTPTFLLSLVDGFIYGHNPNYMLGKVLCLLTIIVLIPTLFYLYTIFTKKAILPIDIFCFYFVIGISQIIFYYVLKQPAISFIINYISIILIFIIFGLYMVLSILPLKNFIFKDPITNKYGLNGHSCEHKE